MAFGLDQINVKTPIWVKVVYRTVFVMTTALAGFIAATHLVGDEMKFELMLGLKMIDPVIYFVGQMIGVDNPIKEQEKFYKGAA